MAWTQLWTRLGLVAGNAQAEREAEYQGSLQRRLAARRSTLWWVAAVAFLIAVFVFLAHTDDSGNSFLRRRDIAGASGAGLFAVLCFAAGVWVRVASHRAWVSRELNDSHQQLLAAARKVETEPTAANLSTYNRAWLLRYHDVTLAQATSAYRFAQLSAAAGFAVLVAGGISAVAVGDAGGKATSATLTAIASLLAAYISRTFKMTYERTLLQLDRFFEQPLIDSYILTAERICADEPLAVRTSFLHSLLESAVQGALARDEARPTMRRQRAHQANGTATADAAEVLTTAPH